MFDKNDRNDIESLGLNCIFIDKNNKDYLIKDLDYIDKSKIGKNEKVLNSKLLDPKLFLSFGISINFLPVLVINPRYFHEIYNPIMKKYQVQSLIIDATITTFLKQYSVEGKTLKTIIFLKQLPFLKQFHLQQQKDMFFTDFWDINDFSSLEYLLELEYLSIPNSETMIDIDFSKLSQLKEVSLQYPIENKTIYQCKKIESIDTRYNEKDLNIMKNWKKLKYFSAYCDNLESFEGLDNFDKLEVFRPEVTSKFKTFEGLNSKSIKKFHIYTEAKKTPKTLDGISGFEQIKDISINGFRKLESIGDLYKCHTLQELTFENCKIPDDILMINSLVSLEKLTFDNCKDIESLAFIKELPNLKYLSFDGNTKVIDGNLDFLKELSGFGMKIYFTDRKHYSINYKDLNSMI